MKKTVILCVLDGWGINPSRDHNAIATASTPTWDTLVEEYPMTTLEASGEEVGLPYGQMGNSEVGHMTLGSGRVILQDLPRIDKAIEDKTLENHLLLKSTIEALRTAKKTCHIAGLFSSGGVHSHQSHIKALMGYFSDAQVPVMLHLFLDGRDVPPKTAKEDMKELRKFLASYPTVKIATLSGRYYAMDRDNRMDRTQKAYDAIMNGEGRKAGSVSGAIEEAYAEGLTDEFIPPYVFSSYAGMQEGDGLVMANFRADRVRQLLHALIDIDYTKIKRENQKKWGVTLGMVSYSDALHMLIPSLFPPEFIQDTLAEVIASVGKSQLHIAETEKYAHVTFFFNGGKENKLPNEEHILIPSPKVNIYDLCPEMSALALTDALIQAAASRRYDFILINYANADMVGHTGNFGATIKAVEVIDHCLEKIVKTVKETDAILCITADHGNAEMMYNEDSGQCHTAHTLYPVPFVLVGSDHIFTLREKGSLKDVAPTLLALMQQEKPSVMTGISLLEGK